MQYLEAFRVQTSVCPPAFRVADNAAQIECLRKYGVMPNKHNVSRLAQLNLTFLLAAHFHHASRAGKLKFEL